MFTKEAIELLSKADAIEAANKSVLEVFAEPTDVSTIALPDDFKLHDIEQYMPHRRHLRGTMSTVTIESFAAYVKAHAESGATVFVADTMQATAVLNLGDAIAPGHADNTAVLKPVRTADYSALMRAANSGAMNQRDAAEFLEDWTANVTCYRGSEVLQPGKTLAAIRKLTIESAKRVESSVEQLAEARSAFESVEAKSDDPLPEFVYFKCVPYVGLESRIFVLRFGVLTGGDKPSIQLRIQQAEKHAEEMFVELASLVADAVGDTAAVVLGSYQRGA